MSKRSARKRRHGIDPKPFLDVDAPQPDEQRPANEYRAKSLGFAADQTRKANR